MPSSLLLLASPSSSSSRATPCPPHCGQVRGAAAERSRALARVQLLDFIETLVTAAPTPLAVKELNDDFEAAIEGLRVRGSAAVAAEAAALAAAQAAQAAAEAQALTAVAEEEEEEEEQQEEQQEEEAEGEEATAQASAAPVEAAKPAVAPLGDSLDEMADELSELAARAVADRQLVLRDGELSRYDGASYRRD